MKKLLIIFSLFVLTLSLSGQGIMSGVVGSKPASGASEIRVSQYKFEQNLTDSYGDNDGTQSGTVVYNNAGILNAYYMDQQNEANYVILPSIAYGDKFTIAMWINHTAFNGQTYCLLQTPTNGFGIFVHTEADATAVIEVRTSNGTNTTTATSTSFTLTQDVNYHLIVTFDKTTGVALIYWDGDDITNSGSIRTDFATTVVATIVREVTDLGISTWDGWFGRFDELHIYSDVLTPTECATLAATPTTMIER